MAEKWTVKTSEAEEPKSKQELEAAVLEEAVESGEVAPEFGVEKDGVVKVNLDAPIPTDDETKTEDDDVVEVGVDSESEEPSTSSEQEEVSEEGEAQEPVYEVALGEVNEGEAPVAEEKKPIEEAPESVESSPEAIPQIELPEDVDKLVSFMKETGGTLEDYVNLNKDLSEYSEEALVREYYKQKNPRLSEDRLARKMKKAFSYDEDLDDPDAIQDKKDAFEDEVFAAKEYLEGNREKYYSDLKLSNQQSLAPETQEAVEYFQQHKANLDKNQKLVQTFHERTDKVFNEDFKGFDFKVGNTKYRVKVGDSNQVKENQSDLNNFISKFLGEDGSIQDAQGYHKAMWAADNVDTLVSHFYEQGRADAIKEKAAQAKGINMNPRQQRTQDDVRQPGTKVRAVDSSDSSKLRFKNHRNR